uniref:Ig-like domain-containing protein n=1 Tax=Terrapene triunguis TaxID=2587831 RepID=A0A674JGV2_9SAUR
GRGAQCPSVVLGGSLSQLPGFTLVVPHSVSVQEGLCVLVPCTFTYSASYDTKNSPAWLYRYWYKDPAVVGQNPPVASSDPSRGVSQETQGRFRLAENLAHGDCSLQISDAQQMDAGRYFLRVEGDFKYTYCSSTNGTDLIFALHFTPTLGDDGKELMCSITYRPPRGPSTHRTIQLRVGWPAPLGAEGDVVSLETQEGDSLNLICEASSRPEAILSWAKGNESLSPGQGGAGHLKLPNLSRGDAGEYRCGAKNSYGSASRALRMHVQTPEITVSRANRNPGTAVGNGSQLTAREGDSLRFLCSITSSPPAALRWVRGGRAVEGARPAGENQLWLELPNVTAEDRGLYGCWAKNEESSAQGTFQLLIEYSPRPGTGLNSSCQHQGPSISCSCSLRSHPPPRLQWQVDGEPLAGNSSRGALQVSAWAQGDEAVNPLPSPLGFSCPPSPLPQAALSGLSQSPALYPPILVFLPFSLPTGLFYPPPVCHASVLICFPAGCVARSRRPPALRPGRWLTGARPSTWPMSRGPSPPALPTPPRLFPPHFFSFPPP